MQPEAAVPVAGDPAQALAAPGARWRHWLRLAPFAVLGLGLVFRWALVPLARFTGDEALFYSVAQRIVTEAHFPALGPPVSGTAARHPGATFYYLMAIPNAIGSSPLWSGLFVATLSVLSLVLLVRMVRALRGERAGLVCAWLAAFSPWLVLYADRIWNSNVAPWMGLVALYGLWRMREQPRSWWAAPTVALLLVLPQFHLSAPILWAVALVQLALWRPRIRWAAVAVGAAVAALLYAPYLVSELTRDFENSRLLLSRSGGEATGLGQPLRGLAYVVLFGTGEVGYHAHTGYWRPYDPLWQLGTAEGWRDSLAWYGPWLAAAVAASLALVAAGWLRALARLRHGMRGARELARDPFFSAVVVGGVVAAALLLVSHKPAYPHYANLLLPFAMVPAVDGVLLLLGARWAVVRRVGAGLVVVVGVAFALVTYRYYDRVDAKVGVNTTLQMTELLSERQDVEPFRLRWTYFPNDYALRILAEHALARPWLQRAVARTVYWIEPARDGVPADGEGVWDVGPMRVRRR